MRVFRKMALLLSLMLLLSLCLPLSALAAPIKMYNVWATWCGPCVWEIPYLGQISRDYVGRVEVIGLQYDAINNQEAFEEGKKLLADKNATYTNLAPTQEHHWLLSRSEFIPATYFVDNQGDIIYEEVGATDYNGWSAIIDELLASFEEEPDLPGDADNNGQINMKDLEAIIDFLVKGSKPASMKNADANGKDGVTIDDALWLINRLIS